MGEFSRWLLHEDQRETFDHLFAGILNLLFLLCVTILFWWFGKISFSIHLLKGYWIFWILLPATAFLLIVFRKIFRIDMYSHSVVYVTSALIVSGLLQTGWSAFAALTVKDSVSGSPTWLVIVTYACGVISCYLTLTLISAYYSGSIYRRVNALLGLLSFIVFTMWPAGARFAYGWFFDLF